MKDYSKFSEKYNNRVNIKDANIVEEHENVEPVTEVETEAVTEVPTEMETTPVTEPVTEVETEPVTEIETEPVTEPQETVEVGIVNIPRLNVRAEAKGDADIVTVIKKDTEVVLDRASSTEDFYKVIVDGVEGYCKKEFITIK